VAALSATAQQGGPLTILQASDASLTCEFLLTELRETQSTDGRTVLTFAGAFPPLHEEETGGALPALSDRPMPRSKPFEAMFRETLLNYEHAQQWRSTRPAPNARPGS
jgi:hypothetical protein